MVLFTVPVTWECQKGRRKVLLFTVSVTSNASRHFKSPLAMGEMPFKIKRASSVPISVVIGTGMNITEKWPLFKSHFSTFYQLVLFYDSYHICYGLESIFLHILLDAIYNIHCNCRIVEVCCSHRYCTCTCENHLDCIFC